MPMNPAIKSSWTDNLRNPEAIQGHGTLRNEEGGRCCLDFLNQMCSDADMQAEPVLIPSAVGGCYGYADTKSGSGDEFFFIKDGYQTVVLTNACVEWSGVSERDPKVKWPQDGNNGASYHLSYLNDVEGLTLPEIAELIDNDETI